MELLLHPNTQDTPGSKTETVPALKELLVGQGREQQMNHCPVSLQVSFLSMLLATHTTFPMMPTPTYVHLDPPEVWAISPWSFVTPCVAGPHYTLWSLSTLPT